MALIISAVGLWLSWKDSGEDKGPTTVVEKRQRSRWRFAGAPNQTGDALEITPVEDSHALQSLTVTAQGAKPIELGSDGELSARDLENALGETRGRRQRHAPRPRPDRRQICRSRRRQVGHRLLRDQLSLGRRRPVRRPLPSAGRPQPLADDFFRLEEEVDLDLRILVAVRAVDRVGLDRFGEEPCGSCLRRPGPGWSRPSLRGCGRRRSRPRGPERRPGLRS